MPFPALARLDAGFVPDAFLRNHAAAGTPRGASSHDKLTFEIMRELIRWRYKLLPYLYQLFVTEEETGQGDSPAVILPFRQHPQSRSDRIDDTFMVGPALLQAPILDPDSNRRDIPLPGRAKWFSLLGLAYRRPKASERGCTQNRNRSLCPRRVHRPHARRDTGRPPHAA